jgi:hypothetical protein
MPLYRHTKLPPPPELGERRFWDYLPRNSARRVLFLLIAFGAVLFLKHSGGWTFGGLLAGAPPPPAPSAGEAPVYHLEFKRPAAGADAPPVSRTPSRP